MIPKSKPQASLAKVMAAAVKQWASDKPNVPFPEVFLASVRGYYRDSMGEPGTNDRGIYDDAFFLVGPETFKSWNGNNDPSRHRPGIASVIPGCYPFRPGNHGISRPGGGYPAFRPATPDEALPVRRDGESSVPSKRPGVACNIHRGGTTTTSSEGCQTVPPDQWDSFYLAVRAEMKKHGLNQIWCILFDGPIG